MRLAIFADDQRHEQLRHLCKSPGVADAVGSVAFYMTYDAFLKELPGSGCDAIMVAHKGAMGMQAVRAAKILMFRIPVVWLSDDAAFLEESYRNGCVYFSADTITEDLLTAALTRCNNARQEQNQYFSITHSDISGGIKDETTN